MSIEVLKTKAQVREARARMEERGISCLDLPVGRPRAIDRLLGRPAPKLGDVDKSWDVLTTAEFVERSFPKTARVLDIGAFSSEILCVLHRLGFRNLTGIDLNRRVRGMPLAGEIRYEVGDFLRSPFPDGAFDAVTSISVIEHGLDRDRLLGEMSRLLAPGGCFIASFDYWPQKIDTRDTKFFGMDWCIFSGDEARDLVARGERFGLAPVGPLALEARDPTIRCAGRDYTFGWMALRKR